MRDRFPRDLFWTAAVPFLVALLILVIGSTLFRLWIVGEVPLMSIGGAVALLLIIIATSLVLWRRHRRSTHL